MKFHFPFVVFILSAFLMACSSSKEDPSDALDDEAIVIPKTDIEFPKLLDEAQDKITSWQYFQEFENDLKHINQGNVRSYRSETQRMVSVTDSLLKTIPKALNTNAITSRMRVVNVRVKLLDETMHQPNVETSVISKNLDETNNAFINLLTQINEKFEKQHIDALTRTDENLEQTHNTQANDSL